MGGLLAGFILLCKSLFFRGFLDRRVRCAPQFQLDRTHIICPFSRRNQQFAQGWQLKRLAQINRLAEFGQGCLDGLANIPDLSACSLDHARYKVTRP